MLRIHARAGWRWLELGLAAVLSVATLPLATRAAVAEPAPPPLHEAEPMSDAELAALRAGVRLGNLGPAIGGLGPELDLGFEIDLALNIRTRIDGELVLETSVDGAIPGPIEETTGSLDSTLVVHRVAPGAIGGSVLNRRSGVAIDQTTTLEVGVPNFSAVARQAEAAVAMQNLASSVSDGLLRSLGR